MIISVPPPPPPFIAYDAVDAYEADTAHEAVNGYVEPVSNPQLPVGAHDAEIA